MWPNKPRDFVRLENDDRGKHFGLFKNNRLVSVISLFETENVVQFRKFATLVEFQGKGYGSQLLRHIINYCQKKEYSKIWCNARENKTSFYQKFGFKLTEKSFMKSGIEYIIMEKSLDVITNWIVCENK